MEKKVVPFPSHSLLISPLHLSIKKIAEKDGKKKKTMACSVVNVWVKPEFVEAFIEITLENARNSRHESGNVRFDFVQSKAEPTFFTLLEVYETDAQAAAHVKTPHFLVCNKKTEVELAQVATALFQQIFHNKKK